MIFTHGMNRKRAAGRAFSKVSASDGACSARQLSAIGRPSPARSPRRCVAF
jgi:hypothetical protein